MTMQMEAPSNPALSGVSAARDMGIRRGGGMESDLPVLSYANMREAQQAGQGINLRRYSIVMRAPTDKGVPADQVPPGSPMGSLVLMPAIKAMKWYGQGYRFCSGESTDDGYDTSLVEHQTDTTPRQWLPSMVSDAIHRGDPIPEEMAPPGYTGETFQLRRQAQEPSEAQAVVNTDVCEVCGQGFASSKGLATHARMMKDDEHVAARTEGAPV